MSPLLESTDVRNKLEDLSGITFEAGQNPYEALIKVCSGNPVSSITCSNTLVVVPEQRKDGHKEAYFQVEKSLDDEKQQEGNQPSCRQRC